MIRAGEGAQWLQYFSHLRYAFLGFCIVEFSGEYGDTAFVCDTACAEYAPGGASCVREVEITEGCLKTGDDILQRLSFDDKTLAEALLGQLGLQVLWQWSEGVHCQRCAPAIPAFRAAAATQAGCHRPLL